MRVFSILVLLGCVVLACGPRSDEVDAPAPSAVSALGGAAPQGYLWTRSDALQECLQSTENSSTRVVDVEFPDSASAVAIARDFLGDRARSSHVFLAHFTSTRDGAFMQLRDSTAGAVDGSNSVYVTRAGCVTYLGW